MTFRDALAQSENIPAIKVLYLAGIQNSISTAQSLGVTTLGDPGQYGLTLVLGGGEVNLLQMTGAYAVFANDGVKNPPTGILRVEDKDGNVLEQYQDTSSRVLDPQIARQINDMLSDNVARTPEFGADSPLYFPGADVADKTGTTNDFHDVWVLGYTPSVSVGAWAGNNDNSPMAKKIAAFIIAPMWHDFMNYAIKKYPADAFPAPAPDPNLDSLPPVLRGNWNGNPSQGIHDILYWVNKDSPRSGPPLNPGSDPQFQYWEYPVQLWAQQNGNTASFPAGEPQQQFPSSTSGSGSSSGQFHILTPASGTYVQYGQPVMITSGGSNEIQGVSYFLNGSMLGGTPMPPYSLSFVPLSRGQDTLKAVARLQDGSTEEDTISFNVQ